MFNPDYPSAIVIPAHPTNYYTPANHNNVQNIPRGIVLHTPEEPADNTPSTPYYFQGANREASTHYFSAYSQGQIYQCVEERNAAIANGVIGKPYPEWASSLTSLNWQSISIEIEGYADTIQNTLIRGEKQWKELINLIRNRAIFWRIPLDREHIIGHYEVSNQRRDPGALFPWAALIEDLNKGDDVDLYHMHVRQANKGIWSNGFLKLPAVQAVNAIYDFELPVNAKRLEVELFLSKGYVVVINSDGSEAGRCGWGVEPGKPSNNTVNVNLSKEGWFALHAKDANNPVEMQINSLAYWT